MGKKKVKETTPEVKDKKKSKEPVEEPKDPKKPQRGLAIGDNFGWTGKLPATLLHEFCQKQKWGKVIFDMKKSGKGFTGIVNLSWENPKTKEVIHVKMIPESDLYEPKETTNEARHYASTYALFRINYVKNMKMILPKIFRDYWSDLDSKRLEILKSNKEKHDTIYNANPFTVYLEQRSKNEQREKDLRAKQQNDMKVRKPTVNISSTKNTVPTRSPTPKPQTKDSTEPSSIKVASFPKKVWANAPFIDFPSELRISIENSIKNHINWVLDEQPSTDIPEYYDSLFKLGFRGTHIKESFTYTSTFIDSLEWLLFHIPEDDLPPFFSKTDQDSSVSLKISKNIQFEYLVKRVSESGFDKDEVLTTLERNNNDELKTCIQLTQKLIDLVPQPEPYNDSQELWEQEIEGIRMIESNKVQYTQNSNNKIINISLNPVNIQQNLLEVKLFKSESYPNEIPGIQIVIKNPSFKLANYIKLSILKQLIQYIIKNGFLGDCLIFSIIEWLEDNISKIIDNPGPLIEEGSIKKMASSNNIIANKKSSKNTKERSFLPRDIENLQKSYQVKMKTKEMLNSIRKRSELPAWKKREQLVSLINANKVTIVTGETGSGKSTQIVQFILDELNSRGDFESTIICTQPRRISTIGLAERITEERIDELGKETGYIIRGENKTCDTTRISFVTTGVLLRMLQSLMTSSSKNENKIFSRLKYIFIDEVHERSVDSDFLLVILKRIMKRFPNLKVILMSATISVDKFKGFFNMDLNHVHIEGRTFPIKDYYLDSILEDLDYTITTNDDQVVKPKADSHFFKLGNLNYDLIASVCSNIDAKLDEDLNDGSILVFLPGIMEINQCIRQIEKVFKDIGKKSWCLPLHSALSSIDQKRVFKIPAKGTRKIVVSTNVAETSITIPDCVAVIDSGRSKTLFFDSKINTTKLVENWCSKAEVGQRRGRSGRITKGNCFHLYTKETETNMLDQPIPEIKRTRLENLYLVVKAMGINKVEEFLNGGLDPPDQSSLTKSKKLLTEIGALSNDKLSFLGKYLSLLPTDLHSGKLLIFGCIFGCMEVCLTLASIRSTGNPFLNNFENRDKIKQIQNSFSKGQGDLIAMVNAFDQYEGVRNENKNTKKFLSENFLSYLTLKDIVSTRTQYLSILKDIGFCPITYNSKKVDSEIYKSLNKNNNNYPIVRAIITLSFYPQIARVQLPDPKYIQSLAGSIEVDPDAKQTKFWIRNESYIDKLNNNSEPADILPATRAFIHPSSVLFENSSNSNPSVNEDFANEEDLDKVRQMYANIKPKVSGATTVAKSSFVAYGTSHYTQKLYLRDITPTSTLAALLFGGDISYDMTSHVISGKSSPGIVLDNWMPVRTWCKNGVLIKRLRVLLDALIEDKLSKPHYSSDSNDSNSNNDILAVIEKILNL